ncbi:thermonuclease family protein [Ferrigenium sp. UT5]|uniref:thermonuclease family protein n=1 Tax=Ferrigenium sp. UT5 TaxID=3242105 RepID=UPI00354F4A0A
MKRWCGLLFCLVFSAQAETFDAKVIAVLDGDTVLVLRDQQKIKARLLAIDAPEKTQPYGRRSRRSLCELVCKRDVRLETQAVDQYKRLLATLYVDGRNINQEQVRRGMAWEYSHHHADQTYLALQQEAQQARRGLWADAEPTPPWQWRRAHPWQPKPAAGTP